MYMSFISSPFYCHYAATTSSLGFQDDEIEGSRNRPTKACLLSSSGRVCGLGVFLLRKIIMFSNLVRGQYVSSTSLDLCRATKSFQLTRATSLWSAIRRCKIVLRHVSRIITSRQDHPFSCRWGIKRCFRVYRLTAFSRWWPFLWSRFVRRYTQDRDSDNEKKSDL